MRRMLGILIAMVMVSFNCFAAHEADIAGVWTVTDGKSRIEIQKTDKGTFEGRIVWLKDPAYLAGDAEAGVLRHDRKNPDASLRGRAIMGLVIMKGFKFDGRQKWSGGTIYDPKQGKTYKGTMSLADAQTLDMRGFIGVSLLGRTEKWKRYAEPAK